MTPSTDIGPSWDLLADLQLLLQYHFMQNALIVGTIVAVLGGAIGYLIVLRGQSFAAHMLSQVGFPGAAGAVLVHVSPVLGLLVFCVGAALGISVFGTRLGGGGRRESAAVGSILAFSLGLGLLFFRLFSGSAQAIYAFLFGTILGIDDKDVLVALVTAAVCLAALAFMFRPMVFASIDPAVADAKGVPVRLLSVVFLLLVAVTVAETVQIVGTLLIFALMVAPGAAAQRMTSRPYRALGTSVLLAVVVTWAGLAVAYFTGYPVGFFITTFAFAIYLLTRAAPTLARIARPGLTPALGAAR
ncbi:MAG TPA: metal ABC transporter permease [Candidatus Solibacter sp.]|jgi:zinc/manganese transport system permease protein|nr:metal ABC transporter permease [Candidatus Solibacter sp.]